MTLEDLKKHVKPLSWINPDPTISIATNYIGEHGSIEKIEDGAWISYADHRLHPTKEEAMQSVEEHHLRELAKFFELEDEPK